MLSTVFSAIACSVCGGALLCLVCFVFNQLNREPAPHKNLRDESEESDPQVPNDALAFEGEPKDESDSNPYTPPKSRILLEGDRIATPPAFVPVPGFGHSFGIMMLWFIAVSVAFAVLFRGEVLLRLNGIDVPFEAHMALVYGIQVLILAALLRSMLPTTFKRGLLVVALMLVILVMISFALDKSGATDAVRQLILSTGFDFRLPYWLF